MAESKKRDSKAVTEAQFKRFKEIALEVEADDSPDALDRAFGRLDLKHRSEPRRKFKKKAKQ